MLGSRPRRTSRGSGPERRRRARPCRGPGRRRTTCSTGWRRAPRQPVEKRTVGRTYTAQTGWRGGCQFASHSPTAGFMATAPIDPSRYGHPRAARHAIHFPKLIDRFWQNPRRAIGWDVQFPILRRLRSTTPARAALDGAYGRIMFMIQTLSWRTMRN
ncbi:MULTISPECIES: replication initiator [unclassified Frankia]|uniref:replication initiator n=1 Tax=unclassified Frankia TaxID=2632575 RepID=UPI0027DE4886|nr:MULTISPECIES: replication initiator [unclassified Frankia]